MKKHRILTVIFLGSLSLIGIILFQVFWIFNSFKENEKELNKEIIASLGSVAVDLALFNKNQIPQLKSVTQLSSETFVVNINDEILPSILEHYLEMNLEKLHIKLDYEYAIYDCETDSMVHINRVNITGKKQKIIDESEFEKYGDYNYYFTIRFPGKTTSVFFNTKLWAISAMIIILALVFFVYALTVMISQKRFSEVQKDFINNMTHELKTPISTIGISARVIADPNIVKEPERLSNYAQIIVHQNQRMEQQVEKVLQSTLSEKGRIHLEPEKIDLADCLKKVSSELDLKAKEKGGAIQLDLDNHLSGIFADKNHLENLIFNLLDNAIKYNDENPEINIKTKKEKNKIIMSISDNGIGMSPDQLKKIFQKFYRVPTGDIHNVKGFGLGLNYVKNIVKAHKWKIEVSSELGKGSVFNIFIPLK